MNINEPFSASLLQTIVKLPWEVTALWSHASCLVEMTEGSNNMVTGTCPQCLSHWWCRDASVVLLLQLMLRWILVRLRDSMNFMVSMPDTTDISMVQHIIWRYVGNLPWTSMSQIYLSMILIASWHAGFNVTMAVWESLWSDGIIDFGPMLQTSSSKSTKQVKRGNSRSLKYVKINCWNSIVDHFQIYTSWCIYRYKYIMVYIYMCSLYIYTHIVFIYNMHSYLYIYICVCVYIYIYYIYIHIIFGIYTYL